MLRLRDGQGTLWDEFLAPEVKVLSDELTAIDMLLDDDRFLEPFTMRDAGEGIGGLFVLATRLPNPS